MNQRIGNNKVYLLAKEAGLIEFEMFDWNPELGSPTQDSVTKAHKFAELIVRECIQVCKNQEYEFWRSPEDREYTPQDCADSIAEHFGVKE